MSESLRFDQSIPTDEAVAVSDQSTQTEASVQGGLPSHPDIMTPGIETSTQGTDGQEVSIGLSADDKHRLAKSIGYLVGRKHTYHRKIVKRAFGSQNIDPLTRSTFVSHLNTLVDAGVLDRKHQRYAISPDANLISVDLDSLFDVPNDDTRQS